MPRIFNIHPLVVDTVTINVVHPDGQVESFELKDDIPVDIGVLGLQFAQHEHDASDRGAQLQVFEHEATHVVGEIFRHTYPDMTDEQIAALIPPKDRMEIINHFFTILSSRYNVLVSASDSSTASTASEATTTPSQTTETPAETDSVSPPDETPSPSN